MHDRRLKVAIVCQRCGREVAGGSEYHAFLLAEKMRPFWDVEILTTCASDYMTWENFYPEGPETIGSVPVRRFLVDHPRDVAAFNAYSERVAADPESVTIPEAEHWMTLQGPMSRSLIRYISDHRNEYHRFVFFTYLYASTYYGLRAVSDKAFLVPTAHDEWPIYLPIWDAWFGLPRAFVFNTRDERRFLQRRFPACTLKGPVVGVGMNMPASPSARRFREKFDIKDPYILYIGRVDENKGCGQLFCYFNRYKHAHPGELKLVVAGKAIMGIPAAPDILATGFISERDKFDALAGCEFLINPSPYESLSMVLLEAWSLNRPVLVNSACNVLVAQCRRSNGGLWYGDYAEFEACVRYLTRENNLGEGMNRFVDKNYGWPEVTGKLSNLLRLY